MTIFKFTTNAIFSATRLELPKLCISLPTMQILVINQLDFTGKTDTVTKRLEVSLLNYCTWSWVLNFESFASHIQGASFDFQGDCLTATFRTINLQVICFTFLSLAVLWFRWFLAISLLLIMDRSASSHQGSFPLRWWTIIRVPATMVSFFRPFATPRWWSYCSMAPVIFSGYIRFKVVLWFLPQADSSIVKIVVSCWLV